MVYEEAPYHHSNARGRKAPAPSNPQKMLEESIVFDPSNIRCRIAINKNTNEFAIFNYTNEGTWHGHVRTWEGLEQNMQSALRKLGHVTKKGKIIK